MVSLVRQKNTQNLISSLCLIEEASVDGILTTACKDQLVYRLIGLISPNSLKQNL